MEAEAKGQTLVPDEVEQPPADKMELPFIARSMRRHRVGALHSLRTTRVSPLKDYLLKVLAPFEAKDLFLTGEEAELIQKVIHDWFQDRLWFDTWNGLLLRQGKVLLRLHNWLNPLR